MVLTVTSMNPMHSLMISKLDGGFVDGASVLETRDRECLHLQWKAYG